MISPFTYDHRVWQVGTSKGVESNETNQAGTGDVTSWRPLDFEKLS